MLLNSNKMSKWLERTELLLNKRQVEQLNKSHVLIVGLGGIGSYAAEFIARSGVGQMTLIDGDKFDETNKNRQLTALDSTINQPKTEVLANRLLDINPQIKLNIISEFVVGERVWEIIETYQPDYIMDCIDSVTPKLEWIIACKSKKLKIITCLGAGGKLDPSKVRVANLEAVHNC